MILFWMDKWIEGQSIADIAPCLFQAVGPRIRKTRTVFAGLQDRIWVQDITGALTVQFILVYLNSWERMIVVTLDSSTQDKLLWKWTPDNCFTTASAYRALFVGQHATPGARILCKARAPAGTIDAG